MSSQETDTTLAISLVTAVPMRGLPQHPGSQASYSARVNSIVATSSTTSRDVLSPTDRSEVTSPGGEPQWTTHVSDSSPERHHPSAAVAR